MGFFTKEEVNQVKTTPRATGCGACKLYKNCKHPRIPPTGKGEKGILIIAEQPHEYDDEHGVTFEGPPSQTLRRKIRGQQINLETDCRLMYSVCCATPDNRQPSPLEVECCRSKVWREIETFKPHLIILLGPAAVQSFLGHRMSKGVGAISKWRGWTIPDRDVNAWVVPMFPPNYLDYYNNPAYEVVFKQDLLTAMGLIERPVYRPVMGESAGVEIIEDPGRLCEVLDKLWEYEDRIAFDYETTGLKPHREGHRIKSVAISNEDHRAYSFLTPERGTKAYRLLKRLLKEPRIRKIAHNIKFEDNWTNEILNCDVGGWEWDSMLAAHVLDNREGVTGLKFQAYVRFGLLDYSSHIEPYLVGIEDKNANSFNRIDEVDIHDLLIYGGIDAMLEYRLAMIQMKEICYERF